MLSFMNKVALSGIAASSVLFLIYITVVSLAESFTQATEEFLSLSYLMIPLIAGFGLQVSLFMYSMHYGGRRGKVLSVLVQVVDY